MSTDIADIFSDEPVANVGQSAPEIKEAEKAPEQQAATGQQVDSAEAEKLEAAETTAAPTEKKEDWSYAAYKDEKTKRQALERQLAEMQDAKPEAEIEKPDVFVDQEAFRQSIVNEVKSDNELKSLQMSERFMRRHHDDYDAMKEVFIGLAKDNPLLAAEAQKAEDPVQYLYEAAVKHKQLEEFKDPEAYKAKIRAEVAAELKEEQERERANSDKKSSISPSLATARGSSDAAAVPSTSLDDIFK